MPTLNQCLNYPDKKISKHFTFRELTSSSTAARLGIDNMGAVTEKIFDNLVFVANRILEPVRDHYGVPFSPNSCFRCEALEKAITWGGDNTRSSFAKWCKRHDLEVNDESWAKYFIKKSHPLGEAVDFEVPGIPNKDLHEWVKKKLTFDQNIGEFFKESDAQSGWNHTSITTHRLNRQSSFKIG